jgi:glutathione peroxidase-family protein
VNGPKAAPIYKYLTQAKPPSDIKWNFEKFLVNKRGQIVERFDHEALFSEIENSVKLLL